MSENNNFLKTGSSTKIFQKLGNVFYTGNEKLQKNLRGKSHPKITFFFEKIFCISWKDNAFVNFEHPFTRFLGKHFLKRSGLSNFRKTTSF